MFYMIETSDLQLFYETYCVHSVCSNYCMIYCPIFQYNMKPIDTHVLVRELLVDNVFGSLLADGTEQNGWWSKKLQFFNLLRQHVCPYPINVCVQVYRIISRETCLEILVDVLESFGLCSVRIDTYCAHSVCPNYCIFCLCAIFVYGIYNLHPTISAG